MPNPPSPPHGTMVLPIESPLFAEAEATAQALINQPPTATGLHFDRTQAVPIAAVKPKESGWFARRRREKGLSTSTPLGADTGAAGGVGAKAAAIDRTLVAEHHADSTVTWDPEPTRMAQIEDDETMMLSLDSTVDATFRRPLPDPSERA